MIAEFFLLGFIIIIGFFSMQFFEKTKIPDILFLMLLGVLLGPVFGVVDSSSSSIIKQLSEFVTYNSRGIQPIYCYVTGESISTFSG